MTGGPQENMPPLALPMLHFGAGLGWLVAGSIGLVVVAPDLARGGLLAPHVIAITHTITLGWITTAIFGALYQLYPVTLGVGARSVAWGFRGFALLQIGIVTVVCGAWHWIPWLIAAGWVVLAAAVGVVAWNLLPQRRKARRGRDIGSYVSLGHSALGLAMAIVFIRIGAELRWWPADRLGWLAAHVHLAAAGFATLTAIGVGSKLFPMFLLSRNFSKSPLKWIAPVVSVGLILHAVGSIWAWHPVLLVGAGLIAVAMGAWLVVVRGYYRTTTKKKLDPGLAHAGVACGFLGITTVAGLGLVLTDGTDMRHVAAYAIVGILGWLSLLIIGMSLKILPFLVWLHRFSPRVGEKGIPKVADLTNPWLQWTTLSLLTVGIGGMALGVALGQPIAARITAGVMALGVLIVAGQHTVLALRSYQS